MAYSVIWQYIVARMIEGEGEERTNLNPWPACPRHLPVHLGLRKISMMQRADGSSQEHMSIRLNGYIGQMDSMSPKISGMEGKLV